MLLSKYHVWMLICVPFADMHYTDMQIYSICVPFADIHYTDIQYMHTICRYTLYRYTSFVPGPNIYYIPFLFLVPHAGYLDYGHSFLPWILCLSWRVSAVLLSLFFLFQLYESSRWFHSASYVHNSSVDICLPYTTPHSNGACPVADNTTLNTKHGIAVCHCCLHKLANFLVSPHKVDPRYVTNMKYEQKLIIFQWICWHLSTDIS